ncbi:MAG: SoxR reducing system RseC family protein [Pseudomonadota bacterium]|nr:SoxR reducing system RseC family protein [Pseudomonadota bacterium]
MDLVEEQGLVVSLQDNNASITPLLQTGCQSCASNGMCGTALLKPLFGNKPRLLIAKNSINAKPGDQVTIGLNRMALVFSSLMIYLFPLLMLVLGAITGEAIAHGAGIENGDFAAILSGLGSALLTFLITSRVVRSSYFSTLFQPVLLDRN